MSEMENGRGRLVAALFMLPWLSIAGTAIMTALQDMSSAFPEVSESGMVLVATMPNLFMVISSALAGFVTGKKLGYKTQIAISALLMTVSGTLPFFLNSFTLILVCRAAFGLGFGFFSPVVNALVFRLYDGDARARMMGLTSASMNVSAVIYTVVGGALCAISWRYTFLMHLLGLVPLAVVWALLPKLPIDEAKPAEAVVAAKRGARFPPKCVWFLAIVLVLMLFTYPLLLNVTAIITQAQLGDAATSGLALSVSTVASAAAGAVFGFAVKYLKRFMLPISLAFCAAALIIMYFADNMLLIVLSMALSGVGSAVNMLAILLEVGYYIPKEDIGLFSGINTAVSCVGVFLVSGYTGLLDRIGFSGARRPMAFSGVGIAALTVMTLVYIIVSNRLRAAGDGAK
ncbi:MAG: MFS transporter [Oscillospiraceae bacterium]|jgi:predicted MFS family arabinose efflux permease|nr:MFS transporter [Oscillospiraceae bacterium]